MRALAILLFASPAFAEDLTTADCAAIVAAAQPVTAMITARVSLPDLVAQNGWCEMKDIRIEPEGEYQPLWSIGQFRFRGDGLGDLPAGTPPTTLDLQLRKVNLEIVTGDANTDYLMRVQRGDFGIDVDFAATYDPAARSLRLSSVDLDFPGPDFIGLTAQIDRIDLNSLGGMQSSLGGAGVTSLGLTVTSNGLFESYFLMAVGNFLLFDRPDTLAPPDYVAGLIAGARATVADLPDPLIDVTGRVALDALLAEMPNPWGTLTLNVRAPGGFGAQRFIGLAMTGEPTTMQDWMPVFAGITASATYTPSPKEE
jgi:hypothetical protein